MAAPHHSTFRVYYEDTDFSGFVYHANYLRFLERARTEYLRALGITQSTLHREEAGLVFVVTRLTIDYLRPARMDDMIDVSTNAAEVRGPILRLAQEVVRAGETLGGETLGGETLGGETLVRADVTIVAVRDGRAVRLPAHLRDAFTTGDKPARA